MTKLKDCHFLQNNVIVFLQLSLKFTKGSIYMKELMKLLSKLNNGDSRIIRQIYAIVYRYLEKRGRL